MKKFIKGFIASAAAMSLAATAFGATFTDVEGTKYEWALSYIEDMAAKGLISGYGDGIFKPEKSVSKLETISLFARAMGSRSEANALAVEQALAQYGDLIDTYSLNFAKEDVAYMLYRGALTEAEATAYLKDDVKNDPMLRYEAATIITKAMGGEAEAKRNLVLDMEYTDVSEIPSAAKKYVYYVSEKNIMSGMGDGTFSPNTEVLRSQISVMLSKTVDAMNATFSEAKIVDINTDALTMTVEDADGEQSEIKYTEDTIFYVEGEKTQAKDIQKGVDAVITLHTSGVVYVDIAYAEPDATLYAIYSSYKNTNGGLAITATNPETSEKTTYTCIDGIDDITKAGVKITVLDLKAGDYLELSLKNGKVWKIAAADKITTIKGATIEAIDNDVSNPTITISHGDSLYNGMQLSISNNIIVTKDGSIVDMNSVYRGDKVTITLEYGVITSMAASSVKTTVDGTISSITISSNPTITVLVNNKEVVYDITSDIAIIVNGEKGRINDLSYGDKVTLTTESNAVTKIETITNQASEGNLSGTVLAVNTAYKFFKVQAVDAAGNIVEENIYCKDTKTTFITAAGATKQFRDIAEGNVVSVYGTYTNGAFEATSVIIVK